ncbi:hypothetical protein [Sporosarcina sp. FA9]|uniref:hypothetical protein n=1 Tax=Sporosarcina sp. FA9 TaxID=3413030 RepID=UPI003F65E4D9
MRFYFHYNGKKFEKCHDATFRAMSIREEIREECLRAGKTHKEIEEAFRAFGI